MKAIIILCAVIPLVLYASYLWYVVMTSSITRLHSVRLGMLKLKMEGETLKKLRETIDV